MGPRRERGAGVGPWLTPDCSLPHPAYGWSLLCPVERLHPCTQKPTGSNIAAIHLLLSIGNREMQRRGCAAPFLATR